MLAIAASYLLNINSLQAEIIYMSLFINTDFKFSYFAIYLVRLYDVSGHMNVPITQCGSVTWAHKCAHHVACKS